MISMIIGHKGSGKTKKLIENINDRVEESHGNVVCIEKGQNLTYDLTYRVRLVDSDRFSISSYDELFGFISGICAGNYDVTDIFVDGTLKIGGQDKIVMIIIALLLGGLGIHNFYLGYTGKGVAQLLLSCVGVGFIWGLIDGIMIFTGKINTDSEGNPLVD